VLPVVLAAVTLPIAGGMANTGQALAATVHSPVRDVAHTGHRKSVVTLRSLFGRPAEGFHPRLLLPGAAISHTRYPTSTAGGGAPQKSFTPAGSALVARGGRVVQFSGSLYADTAFPVMSLARQVNAFGTTQQAQPPDTQLAAGPQTLLEMVNDSVSVWSKSGQLIGSSSAYTFFGVPTGYDVTDPRVLFDTISGRWFASGFALDAAGDSQVYLAVSTTSDPTGGWTVYVVDSTAGVVTDQPTLGLDSVDVILTWNDFVSASFTGSEVWVIQKSAVIAGASSVPETTFGGANTPPRPAPAQALSASNVDWMVYNDADPTGSVQDQSYPALGVFAISGTPAASDVTLTGFYPQIYSMSPPPAPVQSGGSSNDSQDDDRILSAVWQNGVLWTDATDGCLPQGDTVERDCLRLVELSVSGTASPTVVQDFDVATAGDDLYYPATGLDQAGAMYAVFTVSSASSYPSVAVTSELPGASTLSGGTIQPGLADYQSSTPRWGDYSAAATDPVDPNVVWSTGEYATADGAWGTATAALSTSPQGPTVSGVNPTSGPAAGGTTVTISGGNFTGATAVEFGSTPASGFSVANATSMTAVAPATTSGGPVNVTVTTPYGTSAPSNADVFTYASPPSTAPTPTINVPALIYGDHAVTINGSAAPNATVILWQRTYGTPSYVQAATTTADSSGAYSFFRWQDIQRSYYVVSGGVTSVTKLLQIRVVVHAGVTSPSRGTIVVHVVTGPPQGGRDLRIYRINANNTLTPVFFGPLNSAGQIYVTLHNYPPGALEKFTAVVYAAPGLLNGASPAAGGFVHN